MIQYHCRVMPLIPVPPSSFNPAPKVQSAVVRLTPYDRATLIKQIILNYSVKLLAFAFNNDVKH